MLQGNIQILANIIVFANHTEQFPREMCGIGIVQSYPLHTFNVGHAVYQFGNMLASVNIYAIISQFLSYDLKLLRSLTH